MGNTNINWADKVWNPVTGCTKVSAGCKNCYAERMSERLAGRCGYPKDNPFAVTLHPEKLDEPLHWKKPSRIFVGSMTDICHRDVSVHFVDQILRVMHRAPQHTYMILSKRPENFAEYFQLALTFMPHVWLGVSVEDQQTADERIPLLLKTPAAKRFVSYEPALGPVDFNRRELLIDKRRFKYTLGRYLDWLIIGGETGPGARAMKPDWARLARDQCKEAGVPFFLKQNGEWAETHRKASTGEFFMSRVGKKAAGCLLDGVEHKEVPA